LGPRPERRAVCQLRGEPGEDGPALVAAVDVSVDRAGVLVIETATHAAGKVVVFGTRHRFGQAFAAL
jgi:hypothetical protein